VESSEDDFKLVRNNVAIEELNYRNNNNNTTTAKFEKRKNLLNKMEGFSALE